MTREVRLKDVVRVNEKTLPEATETDLRFRYIDIGLVTEGVIAVPEAEITFGSAASRARRLADEGDTIVSTVRTYLRAVAQVPRHDDRLVFSTGFAVLHPSEGVDARYLTYHCQSASFVEEVVARSVGVSYPAINASELGNFRLLLPSLEEQRRIADFLDAETARIDRLVELREKQVEYAHERLEAAMAIAVGDPKPWPKLAWVLSLLRDGTHTPPMRVLEGVPLLTAKNVRNDRLEFAEEDTFVSASDADQLDRSVKARPGDVLLSIKGARLGRAAVVMSDLPRFTFERNLALLRPDTERCLPEWLHLALLSPPVQDQISLGRTFSALPGIYLGALAELRVPMPPLSEQVLRVQSLTALRGRHKRCLKAVARQVALLKERRQAIISAAVSGQLDVTTARGAA
jgi:type I restriction enzyme S subunit